MTKKLLISAFALMALAASSAHASPRTEEQRYELGALGDLIVTCVPVDGVTAESAGGACFAIQPGETAVSATITDDTFESVSAVLAFDDGNDETDPRYVPACGETTQAAVRPGETVLYVYVDGPIFSTLDCLEPGTATSGNISVTFS